MPTPLIFEKHTIVTVLGAMTDGNKLTVIKDGSEFGLLSLDLQSEVGKMLVSAQEIANRLNAMEDDDVLAVIKHGDDFEIIDLDAEPSGNHHKER
jgi:hypothetical protein